MATQSNISQQTTVLWLVTEETSKPYMHELNVDCDCKTWQGRNRISFCQCN